jgi:predicted phosphodiesterase
MWTHESLVASASLIQQDNQDIVLLVSKSPDELMYVGGPLGHGVGVLFLSDHGVIPTSIFQQDFHVSVMTLDAASWRDVSIADPHSALVDLEKLGPIQTLDIQEVSVTTQDLMNIQADIDEIRELLKPPQRTSPQRKALSRKKITKLTKQLGRRTANQPTRFGQQIQQGNADLLQRRLMEGGCTALQLSKEGWWSLCLDMMQEQTPPISLDLDSWTLSDVPVLELPVPGKKTVRLLVLSDTHGFEDQLFKTGDSQIFPPADVLIHCGDWWCNQKSSHRLDQVMAAQTHIPTKIVVRGNHDPIQFQFALSGASYVTKPCVIELHGLVLDIRPYRRSSHVQPLLHNQVDILLTHEPPYGILDRTYRKERVGSIVLRHAVEASAKKPLLWCCGHIHEGRGAKSHVFGNSQQATLVVNAANANSGKAKRVITGPVLIDVGGDLRA